MQCIRHILIFIKELASIIIMVLWSVLHTCRWVDVQGDVAAPQDCPTAGGKQVHCVCLAVWEGNGDTAGVPTHPNHTLFLGGVSTQGIGEHIPLHHVVGTWWGPGDGGRGVDGVAVGRETMRHVQWRRRRA